MDLLPGASFSADALHAEKLRMEVIAQNIANVQTTRTARGEPYRRQLVSFESHLDPKIAAANPGAQLAKSVRVDSITEDRSPFKSVFNPGHPHADASGMLKLPNVDLAMEMVDLISSSRSYEANLAVVKTSRQLARQALSINS
ncbi:MAG: Flagellar basal-body rod protein FlgC [Verrucomicrobia bacterium ADurb.Bin474]|mgnify:FL=1|nr:MAG: Flagellar basal-body rod protein FlgC [Verrucomicrobia bacterium ADurb.Bin474]